MVTIVLLKHTKYWITSIIALLLSHEIGVLILPHSVWVFCCCCCFSYSSRLSQVVIMLATEMKGLGRSSKVRYQSYVSGVTMQDFLGFSCVVRETKKKRGREKRNSIFFHHHIIAKKCMRCHSQSLTNAGTWKAENIIIIYRTVVYKACKYIRCQWLSISGKAFSVTFRYFLEEKVLT